MLKPYKKTESKIIVKNKFITFYEDSFISGNGVEGRYYYESRGTGVLIIATDEDDNFIFVYEYKYPIQSFEINAAAGVVHEDEDLEIAARRELLEETGYESKSDIVYLGQLPNSSPRSSDMLHIYYLPNCQNIQEDTGGEDTEETEVVLIPKSLVWNKIYNLEIANPHTITGLVLAENYINNTYN